jgi:iron complex transport system permease protein
MIRHVVIALAGAGLALCGAVYQGAFRNALAAPSTLGVMSGAQLGLMFFIVFFLDDLGAGIQTPWGSSGGMGGGTGGGMNSFTIGSVETGSLEFLWFQYGLAIFSFLGCFLVVGTVLLIMRLGNRGRTSGIMLIITGQVIGGIIGAIYSAVRYYWLITNPYGEKVQMLTQVQIASFYRNFGVGDILALGIPLLITFLVVMKLRQKMMLLSLEEGESRSMGVDSRRMSFITVGLCTLLTAIIVAFCGAIGFVGFLVPHMARRLVGPEFRYLLPASTVLGALFVLGAYTLLSMTMGAGFQTMLGMFISIGGAVVFLATALRGRGNSLGSFK